MDTNNKIVCTATTGLNYPNYQALQIIITCTGKDRKWNEFYEQHKAIEDFAKQSGCKGIQVWGLKGWQRQLKRLTSDVGTKYKTQYYVYGGDLNDIVQSINALVKP